MASCTAPACNIFGAAFLRLTPPFTSPGPEYTIYAHIAAQSASFVPFDPKLPKRAVSGSAGQKLLTMIAFPVRLRKSE
jgi:hypothetical protein